MVELHKIGHFVPCLIGKAVAVLIVAAPVDIEPTRIRAFPFVSQNILKRPEASPNMVEDAIEKHGYLHLMKSINDCT